MRVAADLEAINRQGQIRFGYLDIDIFRCPPFVMFTNDGDCPTCEYVHETGTFEPQSMTMWANLLAGASSVIDVGAHSGVYSLVAAALRRDIPIHAFEPNPDGYARLLVNIKANDAINIRPYRLAAGPKNFFVRFQWVQKALGHISSGGHFSSKGGAETVQIMAEAKKLDDALNVDALGPSPLMKIDVEGGEVFVFAGMEKILDLRPDIILEVFTEENCAAITAKTKPCGYRYFSIDETQRTVQEHDVLTPNTFMGANKNSLLTTRSSEEVLRLAQ